MKTFSIFPFKSKSKGYVKEGIQMPSIEFQCVTSRPPSQATSYITGALIYNTHSLDTQTPLVILETLCTI
jgi:hypothetical protein